MHKHKSSWKHPSVLRFLKEQGADDAIVAIRQVARDLVSKGFDAGWSGPPFDPLQLAALLKVEVLPNDLISDARLVPVGAKQFRIEYNPHERPSRTRFSISHEIGHSLFPDCGEAVRHRMATRDANTWELEFLCDIAASEILLPYGIFVKDAKGTSPKMREMMLLGDRYKASLEAVLLRFAETVDLPCSVVVAAFQKSEDGALSVQYAKSSSEFQPSIQRGYVIPRSSKAYECVNSGWTSHGREHWKGFDTDYNVECVGLPPVKYDNRPRVGMVVSAFGSSPAGMERLEYDFGDATQPRGTGNRIIAQVVNTGAALGAGFGKAMAKNWPRSVDALRQWKTEPHTFQMGNSRLTKLNEDIYVFQMLAQKGVLHNEGKVGLRYSSLHDCLVELAKTALELGASVHMPKIGAGQAGGDWKIIEGMITEELVAKGIDITVYEPPGRPAQSRNSNQHPLFNTL
jgi:O-acetyl-ADP-ribose deacetylase (regulator of RNase III)